MLTALIPPAFRRTGRAFALVAMLAAAALALAACGEDDADGSDATSTPTVAAGTETPAATTPTATPTAETATATPTATEAAGADGGTTISVATEGDLAPYLVGPDGLTLYIFTNDTAGVSNCEGSCIENWPPLIVEEGEEPSASDDAPGTLGVIERADGLGRQVTYDGMPLYYWVGDSAPGDTTGHEVGGVWFVAEPEGDSAASMNPTGGGSGDGPGY